MKTPKINPALSAVGEAYILICEKCGKKLVSGDAENPSQILKGLLKSQLKERYGKGIARPLVTSCMDICPKDEIAIGLWWQKKSPEFFTFSGDLEEMSEILVDRVKPKSN